MACLKELPPGETCRILGLTTVGPMRRRLLELGFLEGTTATCLGSAPLGDPRAFLVRGAVIALRGRDCLGVQIAREGREEPWT